MNGQPSSPHDVTQRAFRDVLYSCQHTCRDHLCTSDLLFSLHASWTLVHMGTVFVSSPWGTHIVGSMGGLLSLLYGESVVRAEQYMAHGEGGRAWAQVHWSAGQSGLMVQWKRAPVSPPAESLVANDNFPGGA